MIGGKSSLINATWKIGGGEPAQLCRKTKLQVPHKVNYRCSAITVSSFIWINQELLKGWYRTSKEAAMIWQTLQWDWERGTVLHMWLWSLYILVEFPLSLPFGLDPTSTVWHDGHYCSPYVKTIRGKKERKKFAIFFFKTSYIMSKLLHKPQISNKPNIYMYILTICRESAFKCLDCKGISDHRNQCRHWGNHFPFWGNQPQITTWLSKRWGNY